jgi:hypothetical protein
MECGVLWMWNEELLLRRIGVGNGREGCSEEESKKEWHFVNIRFGL